MDELVRRQILETEYNVLVQQLSRGGFTVPADSSPNHDGSLSHISLPDLVQAVAMYRDLLRTLGGGRG